MVTTLFLPATTHKIMLKHDEPDYKRIFLAVALAAVVLIGWQSKIEWPRRQALAKLHAQTVEQDQKAVAASGIAQQAKPIAQDENPALSRADRIAASPRVAIASEKLQGSIDLKGARFDDLTLLKYRETVEKDSPNVTLFSPGGDDNAYLASIGWLASDAKTKVPDQQTLWATDKKTLSADDTVHLKWDNGEGVTFLLSVTLDPHYMFAVTQAVENHSGHEITLIPYAYLNRAHEIPQKAVILHEGPLGVMNGTLTDVTYKDLREAGTKSYEQSTGWFGITDKYWLAAIIPESPADKITFSHYDQHGQNRYQVDYAGAPQTVAAGSVSENKLRLFTGAKELRLLDAYASGTIDKGSPPIALFDRALDFGWFYFLAKPMCFIVDYLYDATGNFGVALLIFIIFVKACLFPLANKSFKSMAQMREIQPEMVKIRERYVDDQIGMHKAMRELYKTKKINPAAGCLPVLLQIIVFLSLFRGLNVTIEMRHAPFYGWIKDLSAADPSNLFTAFGLIPWTVPSWMHLGLLPMLYTVTMIVQMRTQPKPADPVQAKVMSWMPYMMLLFFDKMASGFVLYWTWSNMLSILQQAVITRKHGPAQPAKKAA